MKKLKVSKEELLQWHADNEIEIFGKQIKYYINEDWDSFYYYSRVSKLEEDRFEQFFEEEYFEEVEVEPEPNYNDWIGKDCVFSDYPIEKHGEVYLGILSHITKENYFIINYGRAYLHCMLKKNYVKLLKEQSK